ncbi:MAG: YibE/F family protein [Anaerolineae bacterium]
MNPELPQLPTEDPIDLLVKAIPKHIWVTIIAVTVMLAASWLFFRPSRPAPIAGADAAAAGETLEGRVVAVLAEEQAIVAGQPQPVQRVAVEITRGSERGRRVEVLHGQTLVLTEGTRVQVGDRVLLERSVGPDGELFYIGDFVRWPALLGLALLFGIATVVVGRWVGLHALISMGISVLAVAGFIIPGIAAGHDPLAVCLVGSLLLMAASLYLVYGWTWKTHAALAGLTISLAATALLAALFGRLAHLTGLGTEEAGFLVHLGGMALNLRGVLLGGIVLGAVGALDDVAVGQASATFELKRANPQLRWPQLFRHSMAIGRDHIASMTNTLLLAYVGAALPLFLLMAGLNIPLGQTLNREFLAEEIVRTLTGSLGLILAVPVTGLLAGLMAERWTAEA